MTKPNRMTVRPAKIQISLGIRPVWSESPLCAQWVAEVPKFLHADNEVSDQTGRMPRLIWVFAGRTCHFVGFVMRRIKFSWSSSNCDSNYSNRQCKSNTLEVNESEPPHDKINKMISAPSEDSDQPGHPPSLIRVFAVRSMGSEVPSFLHSGQWRLWYLSFRWAHMLFCWFCHEAAQISLSNSDCDSNYSNRQCKSNTQEVNETESNETYKGIPRLVMS